MVILAEHEWLWVRCGKACIYSIRDMQITASLPSNTENLRFNLGNEELKRYLQEGLSRQKGLVVVSDIAKV